MRACCRLTLRHIGAVAACAVIMCTPARGIGLASEPPEPSATPPAATPAWPCRLVVAEQLRPRADLAWERSATFRLQCARLARAGTLVLLRVATSVQTSRPAASLIGVSADGVTVARVLVRLNADSLEHIAHELEHVLEYLDEVNFHAKVARPRAGVTVSIDGYETDRAVDAGRRAAREVRESGRRASSTAPGCPGGGTARCSFAAAMTDRH